VGRLFGWYKNGIEQPGYENQLNLPAAVTSKGETWYFTVQPSDGTDYGNLQPSPMVAIANTSPSAGNLDVSPNNPQTTNDLFAFYTYSDPDSDPESESRICWYKNAIEQSMYENQTTLPAAATKKGENWYFTILPNDGSDYGTLQTSQIVTIMNTGPSASDLNIIPNDPGTNDELAANYIYVDPDDDPESGTNILWYKDGVLQDTLNDSATVLNIYTAKGQVWHCKVRPSDGTDFGGWVSSTSNITINNTAPATTDLTITPVAPKTGHDLLASYTYADPDSDPENGSHIQWYKNGIEQSVYENQTAIPAAATSKGEDWYFTTQASDGTDYGDLMTSPVITIRNTAPSVSNLIITPSNPMTGDDLTAAYSYSDMDADPESGSRIWWYKNGIEQPVYENQTFVHSSTTSKGENWCFIIEPSDGSEFGSQKASSIITIVNTAPSANDICISPTSPQTGHNLIIGYTYTDPDNDLEIGTEIVWYKDNILQEALSGLTVVTASYTTKGQEWHCKVRPSDGTEFGSWASSQVNITITNTPPSVSDLTITPSYPTSSDDLVASYSYLDVDLDEESGTEIIWYKDSVIQGGLNGSTTVQDNLTGKGQIWHFKVRPKDGFVFGEWIGSPTNVTISNTPPTVSNVKILEESPVNETLDLHATYLYSDYDGDSQVNTSREIRWYRDNVLQSSLNDILTIAAGNTTVGQIWYFTIQVSDGVDLSSLEISPSVGIQVPPNNPPEARFLNLIPSNPIQANSLFINWTFHDIDGDEELGSQYRWYRNGDHVSEYDNLQILPSTATVKGDNWHVKVRPRDGKDFGNWASVPENVTIQNTAPSVGGLIISPNEPKTGDKLFISYSYIDPDLDSENGTEILWYKDGELQRALNGSTFVLSGYTTKEQEWHCKVRPSDGTDYGEWVESPINITIVNTAPSASNIAITPSGPKTGHDLNADYTFIDADMDPEIESIICWFKNGLEQLAYENQTTIPASITNKGENWQFSVKPSDGSDYGSQGWSSIITIANTAPFVSNLTITPTNPRTGDDLIANYDYFDADSDLEIGTEIIWYKDDVLQEALNGSTVVFTSYTGKGQVWHYKVHPKDGDDFGQWVSVSMNMTINNTAPSAGNLIITPIEPRTGNDLEAEYTYIDIDMDPESGTKIIWFKDSKLQGFLNDSTIVFSTYIAKGQVWSFKVKPSDGTDFGNWVSVSINITVVNTVPSVSNLAITPINPKTGDDLIVNYNYFDTDSDLESGSYIRWYKNEEVQPTYENQTTIPTFVTTKGEIWYFTIEPSDGSDYGILKISPSVSIANTAPSVSDLTITPCNPQTGEDLVASYAYVDVDADPEGETEIIWYKNGVLQTALNGSITVTANYTIKGQVWFFKVHPSDSTDFGEWVRIPINATINNTAPSVSDLTITPSYPKTGHELKANYIYTDVNADLEKETEIIWYKNGVLQTVLNGAFTVGVGNTTKGDIWHFKIHPFDGTDYGIWFSSPVNVTIHNTSPLISDLEITPSSPKTGDDLTAFYLYTDADTDPDNGSIIRWYKNGLEQLALENQTSVFASSSSKEETWYFVIQPCDGSDYGNIKTSPSVIITNTAPFVSDLIITPSYPKTEHILSIAYNYSDADSDLESGSYIRWYKNEEEQPTYENQTTIPAFATTKGETWYFTIEPSDGSNLGDLQTSPITTIMNTAPSANDLTIIPNSPMTGQILIVNYTYNDADADPEIGTEILWYKDGVLQEILSGSNTVAANYTGKGQVWHYKARPSDGSDFGNWVGCLNNVTIGNSAPTASSLTITPTSPKTGDNLTASYIYHDPDDPKSKTENGSEILWYKDGVLQGALNDSKTVPTTYTAKNQVWHYKIHPKDGIDFGNWFSLSINVTIGNTKPEIVCTSLFPNGSVYTNDTLVATFEASDTADNDSLVSYYIVWKKNNIEVPFLENSTTVLPKYTSKGEVWIFEVRVFDGSDWSEKKWAGTEIQNSKPYILNVAISGGNTTSDDVVIFYEFVDFDGDEDKTEISWNIRHLGTWNPLTMILLPNSYIAAGDYIYCIIKPYDGDDYGESVLEPQSGFIIVGNTPPELVAPPNILGANNSTFYSPRIPLYVNYSAKDIDSGEGLDIFDIEVENGLVVHAQYRWYRNGILIDELQNHYVESRYVTKGDVWIVSVCPRDRRLDHGSWVNSSAIIIGNGYPTVTNLKFIGNDDHPQFFIEDQDININYTFVAGVSYRKDDLTMLRWYVNGIYQSEYDGWKFISASKTHAGEVWTVEVYPFDGIENGPKLDISVIIESRPSINNFGFDTEREGYYDLWVNASDVRNIISEVRFKIILNGTDEQTKERYKSPWKVEFPLSEKYYASFINKTVIVEIIATSITQRYEDISYKIDCTKSYIFTIEDSTPPRVKDTYIKNLEQDPTKITFCAEIQEFDSGIEKVILYYYFKAINKTEAEPIGFGSSLNHDEVQKWRLVEMLSDSIENTNGETIQIYSATIPFIQNKTNWKIIYKIETVDKNGNKRFYEYNEFNDIEIKYNNGETILSLDPVLITIFALLIAFSSVIVLIHHHRRRSRTIQLSIVQKYNAMKSIRVIFCRTSFGVQFYNEQTFHGFEADIDVLSGLSTAISDFMKDVTTRMMARSEEEVIQGQKTEFEALSRKGLNMLVWNGKYSSIAIISDKVLPKTFRVYIRHIGQEIEDNFADKLINYISPNHISVEKVRRIIHKHLPLYYCSPLALNGGVRRRNNNILSRKEHRMWDIINQKIYSVSKIGYSFPEAIVGELGSNFKRIEAIKFLKKAVKLKLLVELSLPHSIDSSNQPIIAERLEE